MTIPLAFLAPISSKPVLPRVEEVDCVCDVTFGIGRGTNIGLGAECLQFEHVPR